MAKNTKRTRGLKLVGWANTQVIYKGIKITIIRMGGKEKYKPEVISRTFASLDAAKRAIDRWEIAQYNRDKRRGFRR